MAGLLCDLVQPHHEADEGDDRDHDERNHEATERKPVEDHEHEERAEDQLRAEESVELPSEVGDRRELGVALPATIEVSCGGINVVFSDESPHTEHHQDEGGEACYHKLGKQAEWDDFPRLQCLRLRPRAQCVEEEGAYAGAYHERTDRDQERCVCRVSSPLPEATKQSCWKQERGDRQECDVLRSSERLAQSGDDSTERPRSCVVAGTRHLSALVPEPGCSLAGTDEHRSDVFRPVANYHSQ